MSGSAFASSSFGTATRTSSQPADASAAICAVVASTSCVFVSVIDWTTTGAPPPIRTPPTEIWRSLAIPAVRVPGEAGCDRAPGARADAVASRAAAGRPPGGPLGGRAPTSSREPCSPPTGSASSPCRSARRSAGSRRRGARSCRSQPFAPSRSLRRAARRYEIRVDTAFRDVVLGCARPGDPASWIDDGIVTAYGRLHELGWAHSVEAWDDQGLAGGLYGVAIGGLFAAESMFHARTDASKAAFVGLVELPRRRAVARTSASWTCSG